MKNPQNTKVDELLVDVVEYAFTEWLVRRKLYLAFRSNFDYVPTATRSFRDCLREHIRRVFRNPHLSPGSLISTAFLYTSTPEGRRFWLRHSNAWRRFYANFSNNH